MRFKTIYINKLMAFGGRAASCLAQSFSKLPVRQRYVLTRGNRLRLRYSLSTILAALVLAVFGFSHYSVNSPPGFVSGASELIPQMADAGDSQMLNSLPNLSFNRMMKAAAPAKLEYPKTKTLEIGSGQTVAGVLQKNGIDGAEAYNIVQALSEHVDMRKIRPGQNFEMTLDRPAAYGAEAKLTQVSLALDPMKSVNVTRDKDGAFVSSLEEKEVFTKRYVGEAEIQTSLYGSAARSGIPAPVIARMIKIYSWAVDFQRDIRAKDRIQVMYEVQETADGEAVAYGDIKFANLNLGGIDLSLYRYEKEDGSADYYDLKGRSIRKTLMKTPVDGARLSSGFGMRRHPILGYNKMHKGVDFAAPTGTPIYAAGDGKIDKIGRNGGYGNYIRIRHNGSLKTAYAHLHKFAKGMAHGKWVKQGDVIGYIGSTGRSTGPHLHYEVLVDGKQVNPNRLDLPVGEHLKGKDLERFKRQKRELEQLYASLVGSQKFAAGVHKNKNDAG